MLNLKRLLIKILENQIVKQTSITTPTRTGAIYFRKIGKIVWCWSTNDWLSLEYHVMTDLGTIPEEFRPASQVWTQVVNESGHHIGIHAQATGVLRAYMYTGSAITSVTNGAFTMMWITA